MAITARYYSASGKAISLSEVSVNVNPTNRAMLSDTDLQDVTWLLVLPASNHAKQLRNQKKPCPGLQKETGEGGSFGTATRWKAINTYLFML